MSSTAILGINIISGKVTNEEILELSNSWGSAPFIWSAMLEKYLGESGFYYEEVMNKLWPLNKDIKIPLHQRAVLTMTYDRGLILKQDFKRASKDIILFLQDFPPKEGNVNHWQEIKTQLDLDPKYDAIGFHMTSVNLFDGEWDEDTEEYLGLDVEDTFNIYDDIAAC